MTPWHRTISLPFRLRLVLSLYRRKHYDLTAAERQRAYRERKG